MKEQVQWILLYIQEELVDIWKENIIEDLEDRSLEYVIIGEFFINLKKEFSSRNDESVKMIDLKKIK